MLGSTSSWVLKKRATRNKFAQKLIQFLMIQVLQLASQVLNLIGPTPLFVSQAPHFGQVTHLRSVQHPISSVQHPISSVQHPTSRSSTPSHQCSLFSQPRNLSCQSSTASHKSSAGYIQMTVTGPFCPLHLVVVPMLLLHGQLL